MSQSLRFCPTFGITLEVALNSLRNACGTDFPSRGLGAISQEVWLDSSLLPQFQTVATFSRVQLDQAKAVSGALARARGLRVRRHGAVIASHEHEIARGYLGGQIMGADIRPRQAREDAEKALTRG
jgi:hypothetical protein